MELKPLESTFFRELLNAELDVPVPATLKCQGKDFDMIVVPEIAPEGYFRMKYFNAQDSDPAADGVGPLQGSNWEYLSSQPILEQVWRDQVPVELQLHTLPLPMQPVRSNPPLHTRVLYAGNHRDGELVLLDNQVVLRNSKLKTADFCIRTFRDFATPEKQFSSIEGITDAEYQTLSSIGGKLEDGAKLTITPAQHHVTLRTRDGWTVTLTKDQNETRDSVSHTGVVEKDDGSDFMAAELCDFLDGLRYFLTFTMGNYCIPTVVIGYNQDGQMAWSEVGKFEHDWQRRSNWFNHPGEAPFGYILEGLFPKFWHRWSGNKDEMIAVIDCYADSNAMRTAGVLRDAVAKSFAGLEVLGGLALAQTIRGNAGDSIDKVLRCYKIPNRFLNSTENPYTQQLCADLNIADDKGAKLLADVRNYITHPLDNKPVIKNNPVIKPGHLKYIGGDLMQCVRLHDLSQFYLEHSLLRFCGYAVGRYRKLL